MACPQILISSLLLSYYVGMKKVKPLQKKRKIDLVSRVFYVLFGIWKAC